MNVKENENNNIYDDKKEKLQKEKIFNILDGNILYKYIKKIDDIISLAKIQSESIITKYNIYSGILGLLVLCLQMQSKNLKKKC